MTIANVKALTFDVFGTVVDWRTSVMNAAEIVGRDNNVSGDWAALADGWRGRYQPGMARVRSGELPWTNFDDLHLMTLTETLDDLGIQGFDSAALDRLNNTWHRLDPWPDSVAGLARLKSKYVISTLSNGNVSQLIDLAKHGRLPWDCILSAELAKHYKPDPEVYQTAAELLGQPPENVMMVAAHPPDLAAAKKVGFKTAFVSRLLEHGPDRVNNAPSYLEADIVASDFNDLADQLGV